MHARSLLAAGLIAAAALPAQDAGARTRLRAFSNCDQLVSYARARAAKAPSFVSIARPVSQRPENDTTGRPVPMPAVANSPATTGAPEEPDFSGTNVQEAGIDEPDLVKTDGKVIYAVSPGGLQAVDARAKEPALLGTLALSDVSSAEAQLLLHGNRLLVIDSDYGTPVAVPRTVAVPGSVVLNQPVTRITEVDISDPGAMRVVRTTSVDGSFVDARQTGATARRVTQPPPKPLPLPQEAADEPYDVQREVAIKKSGPTTWLPSRRTVAGNGVVGKLRKLVGCRAVRRPALFSGLGTLTVLNVDLDKGLPAVDADAVMTSGDTVYGTADSLYVATTRYYDPSTEHGALTAFQAAAIHRFGASHAGETTYRSTGEITGFLLNQFSMSEDRGVLRVATTETPEWWPGTSAAVPQAQSFVTVLRERDGALEQIGRVGGIGVGERIYAVRFLGDRGYVVTFRQTDPLYTLDLSDPEHPRIAGQLDLLGYSAYLHPIDDDLLLGIGQGADDTGRRQGLQVSLFDVSDAAHPKRIGNLVLSGWASSAAEWDHHAFLYWPRTRLAVLPVSSYGNDAFDGAIGFRIPRDGAIAEAGRVEADSPYDVARRSTVIGDRVFSLFSGGFVVSGLDKLDRQAAIAFPDQQPRPEP